jgi:hypothetical protein
MTSLGKLSTTVIVDTPGNYRLRVLLTAGAEQVASTERALQVLVPPSAISAPQVAAFTPAAMKTTVTATLTPARAAAFKVQRRTATGWSTIRTGTSASSGAITAVITLAPGTHELRVTATVLTNGKYVTVISPSSTTTTRRPSYGPVSAPASGSVGAAFTTTSSLSPAAPYKATLQAKRDGTTSWSSVATVTASSNGAVAVTGTRTRAGWYTLRLRSYVSGQYVYSDTVRIYIAP